ncbi:MAG TPA: LLM class flavin-dependent oxidoreductase [Anaerolineae bacterium]|nr:LLM class flavin-dependent oxidoreductase [Anaerolineae bacterium]
MHFGIEVVTLGDYADPRLVVKLAQTAEAAGWEGVFVWDHLGFVWGAPSGDPWVILSAVAQATKRLKIGSSVTPLPRRRPHVLANTLATLDLLSEGRVIFGVGLGGVPDEFAVFGEVKDTKVRAAMLDEGLEVMNQLWSGEIVTHHGSYYKLEGVVLTPIPIQRPRIPIWVGGESPPALRRAARWDGWVVGGVSMEGEMIKTPEQMAEKISNIYQHRNSEHPFDVGLTGITTPDDRKLPQDYAAVGVTWWLESLSVPRGSFEDLITRVEAGPPV